VLPANRGTDVFVINTCTVTGRSDAKCRQSIRHALKLNPASTVIVVGCYAQVAARQLKKIPGVDYILGTSEKHHLFDYIPGPGKQSDPQIAIGQVENVKIAESRIGEYLDHTRAFLKIQDGCDNRCSYCVVPLARGPSRSVPLDDILRQADTLSCKGYKEIVLTGVHIGKYGKDLEPKQALHQLLRRLMEASGFWRLRLSSLDPEDITDDLLECMSESERICRHFHIPLQSGSDTVLTAMNRSYTADKVRSVIHKIVSRFTNVGLGTDVIAGFPGETDEQFEETVLFIDGLPFTYLHVFPFSPRNGTKAAGMRNRIHARDRLIRTQRLRELGKAKREKFIEKWLEQEVTVLLESRENNGWMGGLTSEYLRVNVPYDESLVNRFARVKVQNTQDLSARGYVLDVI
jgi:threonylcarbamoyladenosine tRNA methylthiotransferase MtaB